MLLIAEKAGDAHLRAPVTWTDDPGTTVRVVNTAMEDLRGLLRLRFGGFPGCRRVAPGVIRGRWAVSISVNSFSPHHSYS